jgi:hypothetical protein
MQSDDNLSVEQAADTLTVRSRPAGINWLGVAFTAFALFWTAMWNRHDAQDELTYWLGYGGGIIFIGIGIALMLPRSIVTVFDLQSRSVRRTVTAFGWPYREGLYPFADIASIATVKGSPEDNHDSFPALIMRIGPVLALDTIRTHRPDVGDALCTQAVETIRLATGLPKSER